MKSLKKYSPPSKHRNNNRNNNENIFRIKEHLPPDVDQMNYPSLDQTVTQSKTNLDQDKEHQCIEYDNINVKTYLPEQNEHIDNGMIVLTWETLKEYKIQKKERDELNHNTWLNDTLSHRIDNCIEIMKDRWYNEDDNRGVWVDYDDEYDWDWELCNYNDNEDSYEQYETQYEYETNVELGRSKS